MVDNLVSVHFEQLILNLTYLPEIKVCIRSIYKIRTMVRKQAALAWVLISTQVARYLAKICMKGENCIISSQITGLIILN